MTTALCCWRLYRPGAYTSLFRFTLIIGVALVCTLAILLRVPISFVALAVLIAWLPYVSLKFRSDVTVFGSLLAVFALLVPVQLLHLVEHSAQVTQIHLLGWAPREAGGIISALNSEIVHFLWNIGVVTISIWLYVRGARGWLMLLNIGWAVLHTGEHIYMMNNYILSGGVQGLPGIFGKGGWLNQAPITQSTFLCNLPIATTWIRPDIHFGWNLIEVTLLLMAFFSFRHTNRDRIGEER
jgi:hypothetical protein